VLLFLTDPDNSVPAVVDLIQEFGQFSGYKINFSKSVALSMGIKKFTNQPSSFPFKFSDEGFTYLGINITPTFRKLYNANFTPVLNKIRDDLIRWMTLPLSWLGRVALIKMNVLPCLLYPMQMIPILMSNKVIKELNGWLNSFIWSKRKPRLKLSKLQLPGAKGGLDLPNFKLYQLACQLKFIVEWLKEDPKSVWLDLESAQSKCPLQNLLFVRDSKLKRAIAVCSQDSRIAGWSHCTRSNYIHPSQILKSINIYDCRHSYND